MMDGYWARPDLDASAFAETPLPGGRRARWYATGDLVRERADGEHEFLGRRDHQIKVRGNRVELESVESVLTAIDGVEHAVAAPVDVAGTVALVAGIVRTPGSALSPDDALRRVAAVLPPYAVPFRILLVDDLPLTGSGKVDRRAVRQELARRMAADNSAETPTPATQGAHA